MDKDYFLIRFFKSNKLKLNSTIRPILRSPDVLVSWKWVFRPNKRKEVQVVKPMKSSHQRETNMQFAYRLPIGLVV